MIELTIDNSKGLGKKIFYFKDPEKFDFKEGHTDCMTYDQSLFVKKALKDLGIEVLDRTMLLLSDIG